MRAFASLALRQFSDRDLPHSKRVASLHFSDYFSQYVWLDDLPLAFISFGSIDYIHTDHLGTPQKMTDSGQSLVWDGATSDPFLFGQLPISPAMNLRLPGQYFDSETGLHHNGMRDYDPTLGRYIESDPIGLAGGINTYAYAGGNPLKWTDPTGTNSGSAGPPSTCGKLAGDVIHVCYLLSALANSCIYWCENAGTSVEVQRNLGLRCKSLIVQPLL